MPSSRDDTLTIPAAVAEGYGSDSTLRRAIRGGRLAARLDGRTYTLARADLDAWRSAGASVPADPVDAAVRRIVASAPALSPWQVQQLQSALGGVAA